MATTRTPVRAIVGCLLGTAVGDALGLSYEGLSRRRLERLSGGRIRYRFAFGKGFCSDDTEHTAMVALALLDARAPSAGSDEAMLGRFTRSLAWRLRFWLLRLPAGIGLATLRAIVKLWLNPFAARGGVVSAGNGPAMRSAILGVCLADDDELLLGAVCASTRLTHLDPRAEHGALAVALAARGAAAGELAPLAVLKAWKEALPAGEMLDALSDACASVARAESTSEFAAGIGLDQGVSGFVMHTVPVAMHAALSHPNDFRGALLTAIGCGGDTDTVAAIVGGVVGAGVGKEGIPAEWLDDLWEWPCSVGWLEQLASSLESACFQRTAARHPMPAGVLLLARNLLFMLVVLAHGFRRLLPPY